MHAHARSDWFFWAHCGPRASRSSQKVSLPRFQTQPSYSCPKLGFNFPPPPLFTSVHRDFSCSSNIPDFFCYSVDTSLKQHSKHRNTSEQLFIKWKKNIFQILNTIIYILIKVINAGMCCGFLVYCHLASIYVGVTLQQTG